MSKMKDVGRRIVFLVLVGTATVITSNASAQPWTYLLENPYFYSQGSCSVLASGDLLDYTTSMKNAMNASGWSGQQYISAGYNNSPAWPQDIWESCGTNIQTDIGLLQVPGGMDNYYGDNVNLVVFAGHGGQNWMIWDTAHSGECVADLRRQVRLGAMGGHQGAVGIFDACSVLASVPQGAWADVEWQDLRQQIGFTKEAATGGDDLKNFFNATTTQSNTNAWLNLFSSRGFGAIVLTASETSMNDCYAQSTGNRLKGGIGLPAYTGGPSCGADESSYPQRYLCAYYIN